MGKISPVAAKYIIHAIIKIEGVVSRPDVVGAVFGQTEGLLGSDLELRELQRSGRIGRIDVEIETKSGITDGKIDTSSSDYALTVLGNFNLASGGTLITNDSVTTIRGNWINNGGDVG